MTEDDARRVELVRAFETEDRDALLLTREDREQADAYARREVPEAATADRAAEGAFVAARAAFAATRLATRHPDVAPALARSHWPRWLGWVLPLAALASGFLANELGTDKRLDLLALPLLGTIAWNLAVYVSLLGHAVTRGPGLSGRAAPLIVRFGRGGAAATTVAGRALAQFRQRWMTVSAKLTGARMARSLHLAAALFVAGLIAGIYLRALVIEYRAGWESTFLGPAAVHALLSAILGPASIVTGVAIPPVEGIAAMRWGPGAAAAARGGVNAGPWLHLYATTLAGLIIVPRLLLALGAGVRAWRLARRFPAGGADDLYIRRLLRDAWGRAGRARVTPYAFRPTPETQGELEGVLRSALGDGARVVFDPPVEYGGEEAWIAAATLSPTDDYHLMLFNLATTPEAENHGRFAADLARRLRREQPGTTPAILIEEGALRDRFAGEPDLAARIDTRLRAWRDALIASGLTPVAVDLRGQDREALARRLEAALLPDGAMRG